MKGEKKKALGERAGEGRKLRELVALNFESEDFADFPLDDDPPVPDPEAVKDICEKLEALEREAMAKEEAKRRERKKEFWKETGRNAIVAVIASLATTLLFVWLSSR